MMPLYCVHCDGYIASDAVLVAVGFSASGARPSTYAHAWGDPACTARTAAPSILHRALDKLGAGTVTNGRRRVGRGA